MHEAFQKRCTQNYGNLISDFNTDETQAIDIFFDQLKEITLIEISRNELKTKGNKKFMVEFNEGIDSLVIYVPKNITKLESLEILYQVFFYEFIWNIPENHPFYELCRTFAIDWENYYKRLNIQNEKKIIFHELVEKELEQVSFDLKRILKNTQASESEKKELDRKRYHKDISIDFQSLILDISYRFLQIQQAEYNIEENNCNSLIWKYYQLGEVAFLKTDYKNAVLYFKLSLEFTDDSVLMDDVLSIKEYLWISLYYFERYEEAKELLKEVYWKDKNRIESLRYLVFMDFKAYMDKNEDTVTYDQIEAERILKNAKKVYENDNDDDIKNILRQLYMILWNYNSPKKVYLEILKDDWKNLDVIFKLIKILYHLQEFEEMLKYAFLHLSLEIQNIDLWFLLRDYYAQIWEYEISKLATIIGTLYDGRKVKNGWEYLKYLNSLDLTQDDEKVYKYFMSFITQKEALT